MNFRLSTLQINMFICIYNHIDIYVYICKCMPSQGLKCDFPPRKRMNLYIHVDTYMVLCT